MENNNNTFKNLQKSQQLFSNSNSSLHRDENKFNNTE